MVGFKYKEWIHKFESNNKRMGSLPSTINLPRREAAFASFMFAYLIHGKQQEQQEQQEQREQNVRVLS